MENYQNNSQVKLHFLIIDNKKVAYGYYFIDENAPLIVDFHGGNFVYGDMFIDHRLCEMISKKCECNVISISNSSSCDEKFPSTINEYIKIVNKIYDDKELQYDRTRIYLLGQGSGGNFALTSALNNPQIKFAGLILNYPFLNMVKTKRKHKKYSPLNFTVNNYLKKYFVNSEDRNSVLANPLIESDEKYQNLPKVMITVGSYDSMIEDSLELVEKLTKNKIPNQLYEIQGAIPEYIDFVISKNMLPSPFLPKKKKNKQIEYFDKFITLLSEFIN